MNYEKDITIDEAALDVEWLEQPRLMMQYARHAAQMKMDMDYAKEQLDLVQAELDKAIRTDPEKYGLEKITESAVRNTILTQKMYKDSNSAYLDAKFEYDVAMGAVRAFDQRKSALENLVRLHGQQYFAGPSVPRDLSQEKLKKEREHKTNQAVGNRIRRTK